MLWWQAPNNRGDSCLLTECTLHPDPNLNAPPTPTTSINSSPLLSLHHPYIQLWAQYTNAENKDICGVV